ncbi:hypothetical protein [Citrobacter meridianamericanus]|uniref:hypothetical protein n=1 Tax=Citrobacter meridianamericanus TaxID=2894201 RepID=UPI0039C2FB46
MHSTTAIQEWADKIAAASRNLDTARQALQRDKQQRETSLRAKFVDWLTTTPAEQAVEDARVQLAQVQGEARKFAEQWIVIKARAQLLASPADAQRHSAQLRRAETARNRQNRVRPLLRLAETARHRLDEAADACGSASNVELLDLVTTNKAVSLMSSVSTSSAGDAVRRAGEALKALSDALPKRSEATALDVPGDLLDLVVDLTFAPAIDLLSWFNMGRLNDAERQCREARRKLAPLLERLRKLDDDTAARVAAEAEALRAIETPHLQAVAALVPAEIGVQVPTDLPSQQKLQEAMQR